MPLLQTLHSSDLEVWKPVDQRPVPKDFVWDDSKMARHEHDLKEALPPLACRSFGLLNIPLQSLCLPHLQFPEVAAGKVSVWFQHHCCPVLASSLGV